MRIAINGFGRIGKNFLWVLLEDHAARKKITVAAINLGPADINSVAYFFKYDSVLGTYPGAVEVKNNELVIENNYRIPLLTVADPATIDW